MKKEEKKGKRILKNNRTTKEKEIKEGPTRVCEREEESVRMCVRRCVRNFEEDKEDNAYSRRTVICLFYTQHTLIRNTYIHTHNTVVQKEKEGKNVRALLRREYTLSATPVLLPRNTLCVSLL